MDDLQEDPRHGSLARSREGQKSKPHLDSPIGQKGPSIFGDGYLEFHLERACFETGMGLSGIPAMCHVLSIALRSVHNSISFL